MIICLVHSKSLRENPSPSRVAVGPEAYFTKVSRATPSRHKSQPRAPRSVSRRRTRVAPAVRERDVRKRVVSSSQAQTTHAACTCCLRCARGRSSPCTTRPASRSSNAGSSVGIPPVAISRRCRRVAVVVVIVVVVAIPAKSVERSTQPSALQSHPAQARGICGGAGRARTRRARHSRRRHSHSPRRRRRGIRLRPATRPSHCRARPPRAPARRRDTVQHLPRSRQSRPPASRDNCRPHPVSSSGSRAQ